VKKVRYVGMLIAGMALFLAACGGGSESGLAHKPVTVKGSDTMVILAQRWAEIYMTENKGLTVQVTGGGSGVGIAALINGGTDICSASRPMKDTEKAQAKARRGKDVVEIPVALDGVAISVHKSSSLTSITQSQLKSIYTGQITNWRDIGGQEGKMIPYSRENSSGTYLFFKEHVMGNADFAREVQYLPGTAAVANAVANDQASIGYGGIAYSSGIRVIPIRKDEASEPIPATLENVTSGRYPLSRNLFFYTVGPPAGDVKAFIDWVLGQEGQKICQEVGYYPIARKQ
jgi:phosphate transport system substrate-binding protein